MFDLFSVQFVQEIVRMICISGCEEMQINILRKIKIKNKYNNSKCEKANY